MAWTSDNKDKILSCLGYPVRQENLTLIQNAMDRVTSLSGDAVTRVQAYLSEIIQLETQIEAERIKLGGPFQQLKGEARRYTGLISLALDVEVNKDVW